MNGLWKYRKPCYGTVIIRVSWKLNMTSYHYSKLKLINYFNRELTGVNDGVWYKGDIRIHMITVPFMENRYSFW